MANDESFRSMFAAAKRAGELKIAADEAAKKAQQEAELALRANEEAARLAVASESARSAAMTDLPKIKNNIVAAAATGAKEVGLGEWSSHPDYHAVLMAGLGDGFRVARRTWYRPPSPNCGSGQGGQYFVVEWD